MSRLMFGLKGKTTNHLYLGADDLASNEGFVQSIKDLVSQYPRSPVALSSDSKITREIQLLFKHAVRNHKTMKVQVSNPRFTDDQAKPIILNVYKVGWDNMVVFASIVLFCIIGWMAYKHF